MFSKLLLLCIPLYLAMGAFVVPTLSEYDYLPIVHFDKQPIIEGTLNGKKAYFMLDSGSKLSLLNSREAAVFGFTVNSSGPQSIHVAGIGGEGGELKQAFLYELGLGMQKDIKASFYACDMNHIFGDKEIFRPVGIIGGDLMKAYCFQIDFKNKQVRIRNLTP